MTDRWTWSVTERFVIATRGVLVVGERTGDVPIVSESCLIRSADAVVESDVRGLEILEHEAGHRHRDDGLGHEFGLLLGDFEITDVPVGSVVTPKLGIRGVPRTLGRTSLEPRGRARDRG